MSSRFLSAIMVDLTKFHERKLAQIDTFDYKPVLAKVSRDLGAVPSRYLLEGEFALKQYYAVALLDPLNEHAVSRLVDPFWHSHVLFTREYTRFCSDIFGGYVHHSPLDPEDELEVRRVADLYAYTLKTYKKIFSDVDPEWWPDLGLGAVGLAQRLVCLHQLVEDPEIMSHALFERAQSS